MIDVIKPVLLNNETISSWFSLRNHESVHPERNIPGLNLGLNTDEDAKIIQENRKQLFNALNLNQEKVAFAQQVHKTKIQVVSNGGVFPETDAFVSNERGMAFAIQVADCAAVLLGDAKNKVIGAAHAGWRGAAAGIIPETIEKMAELGAQVKHVKVFISPCISLSGFEVGEEVAKEFPAEFVNLQSYEKPHVDLKAFIKHQLQSEGVSLDNIETDEGCTLSEERFYSYRRQKEKSGRMMGIIKLNG